MDDKSEPDSSPTNDLLIQVVVYFLVTVWLLTMLYALALQHSTETIQCYMINSNIDSRTMKNNDANNDSMKNNTDNSIKITINGIELKSNTSNELMWKAVDLDKKSSVQHNRTSKLQRTDDGHADRDGRCRPEKLRFLSAGAMVALLIVGSTVAVVWCFAWWLVYAWPKTSGRTPEPDVPYSEF